MYHGTHGTALFSLSPSSLARVPGIELGSSGMLIKCSLPTVPSCLPQLILLLQGLALPSLGPQDSLQGSLQLRAHLLFTTDNDKIRRIMLCDTWDDDKAQAAVFTSEILFVCSRALSMTRLFLLEVWLSLVPSGNYFPTLLENPGSAPWSLELVSF